MAEMEENQKKWAQIVAKAWMDESFKNELLSNPKKVMEENGMKFKNDFNLKIVEAKNSEISFILPAKPEGSLSEEELKNIAAAGTSCCGGGAGATASA